MKDIQDFLDVGKKISIFRYNTNKEYPSQILDIIDSDKIVIRGPIKRSNYISIHLDEEIRISYYVENKGKYSFTAKVISRKLSSMYTLTIKKISETKVVQLREYFRLPIAIKVKKKHEVNFNDIELLTEVCETKDISGGGMKLNCNYKHQLGDIVTCSFELSDTIIELKGKIVRVEKVDVFYYKYSISIAFEDISEVDRDIIIGYIFEQQRILRSKGLI